MQQTVSSDLRIVAVALRLAAIDAASPMDHPLEKRLLELADMVEAAILRIEVEEANREVAAFSALGPVPR